MKRRILILSLMFMLSGISMLAQHDFPVYSDFSLPDPGHSTELKREALKLTDSFLDRYPEGIPVASNEALHKIYDFYLNSEDGKKEWRAISSFTSRVVSAWSMKGRSGFESNRYIYALGGLKDVSMVYIFTGNGLVGEFIRANLRKMVSLPMTFWLHSELRGYNEAHPRGGLETAALDVMLSYAVPAVRPDMSDAEYAAIRDAWHERAHIPAYNWLDSPRPNNWTAVIGCGLLYSAVYFDDQLAKSRALESLEYFVNATIEKDGSYSEGFGYFSYPVGQLFQAALVMSPEEIQGTFGKASLKGSMTWRVYGHLFDKEENGAPGVMRISFGDNAYGDRELYGADNTSLFMQMIYKDGIAGWLRSKFGCIESADGILLSEKMQGELPECSPSEAGLPMQKAFDSGDCFIRNSWEDEGIVLGLKAGDLGSRVGYSHNRPELNSIALGAFGEYLIVTPGSASYRSKVHNEYDIVTSSANTITIDGKSQKAPIGPNVRKGRWDNSDVFVKGKPHAVITRCEATEDGGSILRSEATDAYHINMKEASRTIRFVPVGDGGFFIIKDRMIPAEEAKHHYDYRLHIFNRDKKTVIDGKAAKMLKINRPKADLYIAVSSDAALEFQKEDGYMHHPVGRDYSEFGPKQGFPGSAIGLKWSADACDFNVTTVIYPTRPGEKAPKIRISRNKVTINDNKYSLND